VDVIITVDPQDGEGDVMKQIENQIIRIIKILSIKIKYLSSGTEMGTYAFLASCA